jgi:hypothetical protein
MGSCSVVVVGYFILFFARGKREEGRGKRELTMDPHCPTQEKEEKKLFCQTPGGGQSLLRVLCTV